ncbi:MAG: VOC family protein [Thermoplasmata archaeon]
MRYSHTSITVRSIDESLRFYTEVLELEFVSRRRIAENGAEIAFVRDPSTGARIELTHWDGKDSFEVGEQLDHIAFDVDDLDASLARASVKGARIGKPPYRLQGSTSRIAFLIDPNEVWIELIQRDAPPS